MQRCVNKKGKCDLRSTTTTKKQRTDTHPVMAQILDIQTKTLKTMIINVVEEIKKNMFEVLKENMPLMSENIGNIYK